MSINRQNIDYWNKAAVDYSVRCDDCLLIYRPVVEQLLGDVFGKRVLDAGCGDGALVRKLAARGAKVTGIDGSPAMIHLAEQHSSKGGITYRCADLTKKLPLRARSYDMVVANMVLMDIPRIDVAIAEFARLLSKNGILVVSIPHPCFFCWDWASTTKGRKLYKKVGDYLTPKVQVNAFWGRTLHFHRPLSRYFDALAQNGFLVEVLKEPVPSKRAIRKCPHWAHHARVPSFVVIRAIVKSHNHKRGGEQSRGANALVRVAHG